jgi:two-component system LytT family response regulator
MTGPRVLIVDDEPLARSGIRDLIEHHTDLVVVGECGDGLAAVAAIEKYQPELLILDVQMPEMSGIEVARTIPPKRRPPIIFVTAYDQFAVEAFELRAADYVLKPFRDERLLDAIAEARGRIPSMPIDRVVVKTAGFTRLVRVGEIDWIEAADYCVKIHVGTARHVIRQSMQHLERRLDPTRFFRVHRSAIVNLDRIKEIEPFHQGDQVVVLTDGTKLKLSRSRREALEARLGRTL